MVVNMASKIIIALVEGLIAALSVITEAAVTLLMTFEVYTKFGMPLSKSKCFRGQVCYKMQDTASILLPLLSFFHITTYFPSSIR